MIPSHRGTAALLAATVVNLPFGTLGAPVQAYGGAAAFAVGATTFITGAVGAAASAADGWSITSRPRAWAWPRMRARSRAPCC